MRPAKSDGPIDETILQLRAFLMMPHLVHGRLADIDEVQEADDDSMGRNPEAREAASVNALKARAVD